MKITDALLAEHVVFHCLFDYLEHTVSELKTLAEVRALSRLLQSMLEVHTRVEDHLLIDPMEPSFSQLGQAENFHDEHHDIERDLEGALSARKLGDAKRLLLNAVMISRKHFDKEERIVFPLAEKQLSPRSLLLLGKRWREERNLL